MLPSAQIQQYGGKAAILNHIRDALPDMPIPRYVVKGAADSLGSVLADFNAMRKPVIVRSSSPHEYWGFEGIFDSVPYVQNEHGLSRAVKEVEESARGEKAKEYARQHGIELGDRMHVIIQEQSDSKYTGAMMRHPNNPDWIFISYFTVPLSSTLGLRSHSFAVYDERKHSVISPSLAMVESDISVDHSGFLAEQCKKIESVKGIADGHSLYIEFGFEPFGLYQARPFKKIQTAEFDVRGKIPRDCENCLFSELAFGITGPEGVVLPVLKSVGTQEAELLMKRLESIPGYFQGYSDEKLGRDLAGLAYLPIPEERKMGHLAEILRQHNLHADERIGGPYCFVTTSARKERYDVDLSVPGMKALTLSRVSHFLVHDLMRLFSKADVITTHVYLLENNFFKSLKSIEDKVRIISNGKEAVVLPE